METRDQIEAELDKTGRVPSPFCGFLAEFLRNLGIPQGADPIGMINIAFGGELINQGILLEGLRMWKRVSKWGITEISLARKLTDPSRLTNAIAEQFYGAFGRSEGYGLPGLVAGAILGENAAKVSSFYEQETEFLTRVVGVRFEDRADVVEDLTVGEQLFLVWEQDNPYDPKALAVMTRNGHKVGYIRRSIARMLVARIKSGTGFVSRVGVLLGEEYDANERVWVQVQAVPGSRLPVPRFDLDANKPGAEIELTET